MACLQGITETEVTIMELAWICPMSSAYMMRLYILGAFVELLTVAVEVSMTLSPPLGTLFFLLGRLVQPRFEHLCLILLYLVMLCLVDIHGRPTLI